MTEPKTNIEIFLNKDNPDDTHPAISELKKHYLGNNPTHLKCEVEVPTCFLGKKSENLKINRIKVLRKLKIHSIIKNTPIVIFKPSNEEKDISESYKNYVVKTIRVTDDYPSVINTVTN